MIYQVDRSQLVYPGTASCPVLLQLRINQCVIKPRHELPWLPVPLPLTLSASFIFKTINKEGSCYRYY